MTTPGNLPPWQDAIQQLKNAWFDVQQNPQNAAQIATQLEAAWKTDQSNAKSQGDMEGYFAIEGAIGSLQALAGNDPSLQNVLTGFSVASSSLLMTDWPPSNS